MSKFPYYLIKQKKITPKKVLLGISVLLILATNQCALASNNTNKSRSEGQLINFGSPLSGVGNKLADKGIYFLGNDVNELFSVTGGGLHKGSALGGQADISTILDLHKLFGWEGGVVTATLDYQYGSLAKFPNNNTGATLIGSGIQGPGIGDENTYRLSELSYSQYLFNKKLWFLIGRTQPTWFFNLEDYTLQFESTNVVLGSPTQIFNTGFTFYPEAEWGGMLRYMPTQHVHMEAGVYEDNSNSANPNDHNLDFGLSHANGVYVPMQIGVSTNITGRPGKFDLGGYYDSAQVDMPAFDTSGNRNHTGIYIHGMQKIWSPDGNPARGLSIFGQASWATSGKINYIDNAFAAGIIDKGPFAERPHDTVGLLATYETLGSAIVNFRNAQTGPNNKLKGNESAFEAEYTVDLGSGVTIRPFVQYILHPDQIFTINKSPNLQSATVVGLNLDINFNEALGLPIFHQASFRP